MKLQRETNEERFASIYNAHLGAVVNYATRRTDHASAIDAAAETFSIAWRRLEDVPPEPQTLPWLYGVARRVLANQRRGDARRSALHDRLRQRWTEPVVDEHSMAELHPLSSALESLSPDDRDIVLLAGAEGLSSAEIANVLEVSVEVARNRLSRARKRLRTSLQELDTGPDMEVTS